MDLSIDLHAEGGYQLRFRSLANPDVCLGFPCDASGRVDLDRMSERVRTSYFYARTVIGREFSIPDVASRCPR
jgi:hypothetical protein